MENFAAIDFETANEQRTSVCSVGVVIVRNGEIADSYYSLIRPEPEYYTYWNTRVVRSDPGGYVPVACLSGRMAEIAPRIEGLTLVAHNKAFDEELPESGIPACTAWIIPDYGLLYFAGITPCH